VETSLFNLRLVDDEEDINREYTNLTPRSRLHGRRIARALPRATP
jgi:hypothetical protein